MKVDENWITVVFQRPFANTKPTDQVDSVLKVLNKHTKSVVELMEDLKLKHRHTFRPNYLRPALNLGLIEMTIPDKVDIYTLQKLLTHKDPRITQRYAHLVDESLKRGAEVNADLISDLISNSKDKEKEKQSG